MSTQTTDLLLSVDHHRLRILAFNFCFCFLALGGALGFTGNSDGLDGTLRSGFATNRVPIAFNNAFSMH